MEAKESLKLLAFKKFNNNEKENGNLEDVINDDISISENSLQYEENDFMLAREMSGEIREESALKMMTVNIVQTYKTCKSDYDYVEVMKPRRELTIPSEGVYNEGKDNIECNLIVFVHDIIQAPNHKYEIIDLIGQGISGQVFKCIRDSDQKLYAMKIIKNKKAYKNQAIIELKILEFLNNEVDKQDLHHIIRLYDHFVYKEHLCIIFELLNENLYELLRQNYFQGISFNSIRFILKQILEAVYHIQKANLIHCDLKPENILLKIDKDNTKNDIIIKITDFGSACFKNSTIYHYIQSRYYRAPEVLIGCGYSSEIDMWSIGCIAAELYLGEPLLPGSCEYDQILKIEALIGEIPRKMLNEGRNTKKYYSIDQIRKTLRTKSIEDYFKEYPNDTEPKYEIPLGLESLDELTIKTNQKKSLNSSGIINIEELESFVHFLKGLLAIDPKLRWNAKQALRHPFITKEKFEGNFNPNYEEVSHYYINSIENSYISDQAHRYMNPHLCQSMIHNNYYFPKNMSASMSNISYNNSSQDMSCYQYNMNKLPMKMLKNFPYARLDELNLMNKSDKKNNKNNNKIDKGNNTFMMTSHDGLFGNNSFTSDNNFFKQKRRKIKDNIQKNKYSQMHNYLNQINNQGSMYNMMPNNRMMVPSHLGFDFKRYSTGQVNNLNKSLFGPNYKINLRDYEGLMPNYRNDINRSFDTCSRARSKSDFNQANPQINKSKNQLNMSNYSTHHNEIPNRESFKSNKLLYNLETPVNSNKNYSDKSGVFTLEIKEEELLEDEVFQNKDKIIK